MIGTPTSQEGTELPGGHREREGAQVSQVYQEIPGMKWLLARGISVPAGPGVLDQAIFGRQPSASDQTPLYSSPENAYDSAYKQHRNAI